MTGGGIWSTSLGIAKRQLRRAIKSPPLWLPALMFPLLLFAAFAGGLQAVGASPRFDYPDYTTFQFVYVLLQAAAASGMLSGLAIAEDFENGFARRMMLATRSRWPLAIGYVMAAFVRGIVVSAVLFSVGLVAGMEVSGSAIEIAAVIALALGFNVAVSMWSAGFAFRARSLQAGPLFQLPILIIMFLLPVFTTRELLADWVQAIADYNPITAILEAARGLMVGEPVSVGLAFGVLAGAVALLTLWIAASLRGAEAAGGR
jgi:ABC-2 type transport system permease protein